MPQIKNSLDTVSLKKILRGAFIAGGAVAIIYILEAIGRFDFGSYSELVVGIGAILINAIREFRKGE